jgi:hypothetical protein
MSKKYFDTKAGSLESAVLEAVSPAQQAAIAIAKKEKGEKPKNEEKVECPKCKGEGCDHCDGKGYHMSEAKLQEKPADLLVLQFRSSSDAARAYKVLTQKVAGNMVPYEDAYDEGDELVIEFPDDADKLMKDMKSKGAPSFKVLEREEYSDFAKKKTEELTAKQKKIDMNKDGKITGDDLAKLRAKGAKKEEVELEEKYSAKQYKMAFGVLNDPRWKGGNMTQIVNTIEKIAKGLSKDPAVAKAIQVTNEQMQESMSAYANAISMWKEGYWGAKKKKSEEKEDEVKGKKTMTGKPLDKIEVSPEDKDGE